jgi:hypothetical protein
MSRSRLPAGARRSAVACFALALPFVSPFALLAASGSAQARPPHLHRLGPVPDAPAVALADAGPLDLASLPPTAKDVVLRAAAETPASALLAALDALRARGVKRVHFAACLPDGTPGAVTLALPETADAPAHLTLRAHRERAGIPTNSLVPLLRRFARSARAQAAGELVLAIEVPPNATLEQTLQVLVAASEGEVGSGVLRGGAPLATTAAGTFAFDLDGAVVLHVQPATVAVDAAGARAALFGFLTAPADELPLLRQGGAGGRFAGRGGAAAADVADGPRRLSWVDRQVLPDGSLRLVDGAPDLQAVALRCLTFLADGATLDAGTWAAWLRPNLGYLLSQQRDDGSFEPIAPRSVARHAQITYALAEAAGLSPSGALLHEALVDALRYLASQRELDGSFAAIPGTPGDAVTTAWARMACMSAEFFGFDVPLPAAATLAWFDRNGRDDALPAAAELCARVFSGQDGKTTPRVAALAEIVLAKGDAAEPQQAFWATLGLFQIGGRPWQQWNKRVDPAIVKKQSRDGEFHGTWAPPAGLTRAQATTLNILTLQAHYRYSKLVR